MPSLRDKSTASGATAMAVGTEAVLARGFMPRASGGPRGRPLTLSFFKKIRMISAVFLAAFAVFSSPDVLAQGLAMPSFSKDKSNKQSGGPVEVNGDQIEFIKETNKMIASGHVVISQGETKLSCDRVEFSRDTNIAVAEGHVVLSSSQGRISSDFLTYNFEKMTGSFMGAKISSNPYYGAGDSISKLGEKQIQMQRAYLTTCDLDKPHFRMLSKKVDVYPKDKVIARNVLMIIGKVPVVFIPQYTQRLDDKRPRVIYTPGYDKEWGAFLLQQWRYYLTDNAKGTIHLDYREKKAFASGLDLVYQSKSMGSGSVHTYYMNEITPQRRHFWQEKRGKSIYAERFKAEWRHKWAIDDRTDLNLQYYKLSDATFLKDYFKREYQKDSNPLSYFLLTRNFTNGTFSFRTDARVNRFISAVDRLPEIRYDVTNQKIGPTGLYFKSANAFVNLAKKNPSPTEVRQETVRIDSENEVSYPLKVSFIEFRPFVGGRQTYYTKTNDTSRYDLIRGIFTTGADLSTKFFRIFDTKTNLWGMDVNRLRHIITPSVAYLYSHEPTVPYSHLDSFDVVDSLDRVHTIAFSFENKLQTKRKESTVELLRATLSTTLHLKEDAGKGGFDHYKSDIEFRPTNWLKFYSDSDYDVHEEKLSSANFDIYLNSKDSDRWSIAFGKRYTVEVDDQITTELNYKLNPKWKFRVYGRFDINKGMTKAQEFTVTRDLHCWEVEMNFNETRGSGSEIWIVFRLKAFPDMSLDFGNSFNKRKTGSQSSEGQ